jgi:hypothetical protein
VLFRSNETAFTSPPESLHQFLMSDVIELLLFLVLHVNDPRFPEDIQKPSATDIPRNNLGCHNQVPLKPGKGPYRIGKRLLLINDKLFGREKGLGLVASPGTNRRGGR